MSHDQIASLNSSEMNLREVACDLCHMHLLRSSLPSREKRHRDRNFPSFCHILHDCCITKYRSNTRNSILYRYHLSDLLVARPHSSCRTLSNGNCSIEKPSSYFRYLHQTNTIVFTPLSIIKRTRFSHS